MQWLSSQSLRTDVLGSNPRSVTRVLDKLLRLLMLCKMEIIIELTTFIGMS